MCNKIKKILITQEQIKEKIRELGGLITNDYKNSSGLIAVGILKGSFIFFADLIREIDYPLEIDFMLVSSYHDKSVSSGEVKIKSDISISVVKKDILLVEDIVDTGYTMARVKEMFTERGANSVKICTLLNKPNRREVDVNIDYKGFDIPDEFVVGYGLDYAERYRNLSYIGGLGE